MALSMPCPSGESHPTGPRSTLQAEQLQKSWPWVLGAQRSFWPFLPLPLQSRQLSFPGTQFPGWQVPLAWVGIVHAHSQEALPRLLPKSFLWSPLCSPTPATCLESAPPVTLHESPWPRLRSTSHSPQAHWAAFGAAGPSTLLGLQIHPACCPDFTFPEGLAAAGSGVCNSHVHI